MKLVKQKISELFRAEYGMIIFISALLLFHGLNNYIILVKSHYCFWPDTIAYFERSEQVFQILKNVRIDLKSIYETYYQIFNYSFRPPLIFVTASPFLLFGMDRNIVTMSNLIYFAILLFATYGIGRKLYNYKVGVFSAFLLSMFPTVFSLSRVFGLDFGLAAMVTLTFYLFTLDKFGSLWFSLLTGVVIGLGSLSKESYFVFTLPILLYFFFLKGSLKDKKAALNFVFLIITALFIATVYYLKFSYVQQHFYHMFQCETHTSPYFYLQSILGRQLMPVFSLLLLLSLIRCFRKKEYWFFLMALVPLVLFSLSPNKQDRFILPIFPYFAIIIAKFILSILKHRRTFVISLVLFSCLQYFIISYGSCMPFLRFHAHNFLFTFQKKDISDVGLFSIINDEDYINSSEQVIKIISDNLKINKAGRKVKSLFIVQNWGFYCAINYLWMVKKIPWDLWISAYEKPGDNFGRQLIQSDFIIIEDMAQDAVPENSKYLYAAFQQNTDKFEFVKTVLLPEVYSQNGNKSSAGTKVRIYKKINT